MRRDLLIAGGLAALVVGGMYLASRIAFPPLPVLGSEDAVALRELELRDRPDDAAPPHAFIAPGSPIRIETTARLDWVYVYQRLGTGVVLEGYVRTSHVAPPTLAVRAPATFTGQFSTVPPGRPPLGRPPDPGTVFQQSPFEPSRQPSRIVLPGRDTRASDVITPRPRLPWMDAPLRFLTGELPRGAAVDYLVAETERARAQLDSAFQQATGGPALTSLSTYRSFADQASIVAGVLRDLGLNAASDTDAIRRGLLQNLTTRSIPGFSQHHWGSTVDVLSVDANAWRPRGPLARYADAIAELAPHHGLFVPYREGAYPEPTRPHYNPEPWHLLLTGAGAALRQRWLREVGDVPTELSGLLDRAARAIAARAGISVSRTREALGTIDLVSYVRNIAPVPSQVIA